MAFLTPAALTLASLLPVIAALYFLKLRRDRLMVASTYLWETLVRDVAANAPWQRLRPSWLLLLQLLFVLALTVAAARPFRWVSDVAGDHLILVIDTSASMGAVDVMPHRLGAAVAQAGRMADNLPADSPVTLITAGGQAQVLLANSQDRALLRRALAGLEPGSGGADMTTALELAQAIAGGEPGTTIVVLSDGGISLPEGMGEFEYVPVGASGENQGFAALGLEIGAAGGDRQAFVRLHNYGEAPANRRLTVYADGRLVAARDVTLPPGQDVPLTVADLPPESTVVEARLDGRDLLAADDRATAVAPVGRATAIQIVGPGNRFLETALALLPGVEVTTIPLHDYEADPAGSAGGDAQETAHWLTIFDGVVPAGDVYPPGALLFLAPLRATPLFSVTGTIALPTVQPADAADPLLRYVDLRGLAVEEAVRVPLPPWGQPVILGEAPDGTRVPLLIRGQVEGRLVAVLTFDLRRSDLPLRVAFPLLMANLVEHLAPGMNLSSAPATVTPGEPVALNLPAGAVGAVVVGPDGSEIHLPLADDGRAPVFSATSLPGVYEVFWETEGGNRPLLARFAANLFDPGETDIRPRATLQTAARETTVATTTPPVRQEWWRRFAAAALGLLLLEWLLQYRGGLVYLLAWVRR
jgi:hypothetical protein